MPIDISNQKFRDYCFANCKYLDPIVLISKSYSENKVAHEETRLVCRNECLCEKWNNLAIKTSPIIEP